MANPYFQFKQFIIYHDRSAMKVTTDACLFGAWCATEIQTTAHAARKIKILDIGTGTGLLSLMIAQKNACCIDAVEIDKQAAEQATENIDRSLWKQKIIVHTTDVLKFSGLVTYDIIVSNPPFYEHELLPTDDKKNLAHHNAGLKFTGLAGLIKNHLTATGSFYLLLPYKRKKETEIILQKEGLHLHKKIIVSPSAMHAPSRVMFKGSFEPAISDEKQLVIKNESGQYSNEFISLLKDYYLYL